MKNSLYDLNIPGIALGTEIPHGVERYIELEERARKAERKARLYFWVGICVSVACMIGGWLLGKYC